MNHGCEHTRYASRFLSRRSLLRIGGLGCLGLNLAGLFRAEASAAGRTSHSVSAARVKSCILVFYYGGPSHLDTWDMKPQAPAKSGATSRPLRLLYPEFAFASICRTVPA